MKFRPIDLTESCMSYNGAGVPYEELSCLYPTLGRTYLPFEPYYDPTPVKNWMGENSWIPSVVLASYFLMIVGGRAYFANRPAWNWRRTLAAWNLLLSIFSLVGFLRILPQLAHNVTSYSWRECLCMDPFSTGASGSTGLWGQLFALSKLPELLDTFFIIIHKKKLIFLHWFHHATVFYFLWHGYNKFPTMGIFICVMNYGVHAVMYFYYFLMSIHAKPAWFNPKWITVAQISQMFVGVALTPFFFWVSFVEEIPGCVVQKDTVQQMGIMYGAFLVLFMQIFVRRFVLFKLKIKKEKKDA